ncbi:MAG: hypothetical protein DRG40_00660 [Deltaproteobacteria bacterium]|nr:MAG: hypothetical protein DRG40_00660 [Deltaproteobacteria bacterium]
MAYDPNSPAKDHDALADIDKIRENTNQLRKFEASDTEPSSPVAGMFWLYTPGSGNWVLKQRNPDNSGWVNLWEMDPSTGAIKNIFASVKMEEVGDFPAYSGNADKFLKLNSSLQPVWEEVSTEIPDSSVTRAKLKTSSGAVSSSLGSGVVKQMTLPGGEYGFYPRVKCSSSGSCVHILYGGGPISSYVTNVTLRTLSGYTSTIYVWQRYVTSSGEVFWIFLLREKETGKIIGGYQAPDHPCFGNGNDPILVPHPFGDYDPEKHEIIVINPSPEQLKEMKALCRPQRMGQPRRDLLELFHGWREEDKDIGPLYEPDDSVELEYPKREITVGIVEDEDDKPLWLKEEARIIKVDISKYQPDCVRVRPLKRVNRTILGGV